MQWIYIYILEVMMHSVTLSVLYLCSHAAPKAIREVLKKKQKARGKAKALEMEVN